MMIKVFVQNEAGSNLKNYHDEKTLEYRQTKTVSRAYPYPYGFIVGTNASDGCNLDVFVITRRPLRTGQLCECEVIALMEQFEDGLDDHNVLARFTDETIAITDDVERVLTGFVLNVFSHVEGKQMSVGQFLGVVDAEAYVMAHQEPASAGG
jgi:inorganic pyrophosphatase